MDKILKQICALLDRDDVELQCSAARVLGELGPKSDLARRSLAAHLSTPNLTVKNYLLSALERLPGPEALPFLFPLLREGGKVQERALSLIAASGAAAASHAKKLFPESDEEGRKLLVRLLGTLGTEEACGFLIDRIIDASPELRKHICLALREAIAAMPGPRKRALLKKVNALLASARTRENQEQKAAGVALLGCLADASAAVKLLAYAMNDQPAPVREQALSALARLELPPPAAAAVARAVIPMLAENDFQSIVRNALAILQKIDIPRRMDSSLKERLGSPHPMVRSFILSRIRTVGSDANISMLLGHLNSADFQERRAAQDALAAIPGVAQRIIRELEQAKDYETAMRLVSILRAHKDRLRPADKRHLIERMEKLHAGGDERYSAYAAALKVVDPDFLVERIASRVKRLKAAGNFAAVEGLLRVLSRHLPLPDELSYELAVARLRGNLPDLSPLRRRDDEGLRMLAELLGREGFPLLKRLKSEKCLGPLELYHIGFHFSEKLFRQREFGVALLTHLLKKAPRGRLGAAARKKLRLVGAAA